MADSLIDLDPSAPVFNFDADWETTPSQDQEVKIIADIYPGTIHSISFYRDAEKRFKVKISDYTTNLYPLLIFFADRSGRYKNFWFPDQAERFSPLSIAEDFLSIEINKIPNLYLHGHERLFLKMANGDRISRKIESFTQLTNTTKFEFEIALPEIAVADIEMATLLFLVRLDSDEAEISYDGRIPSVELSFVELLQEYDSSGV